MTLTASQRRLLAWLAGAVVVVTVGYLIARSSSEEGDSVATAGTLPELTTSTSADPTTTSEPAYEPAEGPDQSGLQGTSAVADPEGSTATTRAPRPSSSTTTPHRDEPGRSPDTSAPPRTTTAPPPAFRSAIGPVTAEDLGASWRPEIQGCAAPEDLRMLTVSHWGYDGEVHEGRIVVHSAHAEAIVEVFRKVFAAGFPIERMQPVADFDGDDGASMRANNTSGYNCRYVAGTRRVSEHALGQAIDVNPLHNPYVKGGSVDPAEGARWADRSLGEPGMIQAGDAVVTAFGEAGWKWGGAWQSGQDHQHFSAGGR